jgi:hypothetical protein
LPSLERADKWAARAAEWTRLAELTSDPFVRKVCEKMAEQDQTMAQFWRKW